MSFLTITNVISCFLTN